MLYKNIEEVNGKVIKSLINKSATQHTKIKSLYERYKQTEQGVPILTRRYQINNIEQKDKINNKIANDFMGEIVDMKVGFFCGVPISYVLDKEKYQKEQEVKTGVLDKIKSMVMEPKKETVTLPKYDKDLDVINNFNKRNSIADLDLETSKLGSICGYCGRLLYVDIDGQEKIKKIDPWELIFIGDSIENPTWVIRYFDVISYNAKGEEVKKSKAELYSAASIEYYVKNDNGDYIQDTTKETVSSYWGACPLFGFANNEEMLGDVDKVLDEIDGYDKTISDVNSEIEQFRLAYLAFLGCSISREVIQEAQKTGAFGLPEGADAKFLVKNLDDSIIEHHLDRLEKNIYRFSATPNMNDINFGGNMTGVAMKYKFRPFEDKCKRSELKFEKSLQSQYEKLCYVWKATGKADIDPYEMDFVFTRNYPQNLLEEIAMLRDSKGIVSEPTRFSLVSFINDPEAEIERLEREEHENLDNFIERNERLAATGEQDKTENTNAFSNTSKEEDKPKVGFNQTRAIGFEQIQIKDTRDKVIKNLNLMDVDIEDNNRFFSHWNNILKDKRRTKNTLEGK